MKSNITFVLFTKNEERRIIFPLKNFSGFGDIIILDGGSTDKTQEIAESMGARFFLRPDITSANVESKENFDFIKAHITTEWIYWGYVDNIAPLSLVKKIVELSEQNVYKKVNIPLYTYLWGNTINYAHKSYAPFLFHKDYIDFSNNYIHGLGKFLGTKDQILFLPNTETFALKHFSTYNVNKFIQGHLRYAEAEAEEKHTKGLKFSAIKMIAAIMRYVWIYGRYSYKNGILGLLIVLNYASFRIMAYTKLYELNQGITLDSIEKNYDLKKEIILKEFASSDK
ncbi:MAG TPA: hypothetical protein PKA42_01215 [Candidatus Paceibacterota bacterium]|nr:hypothetical protein [Candidatus Paceibacterota bacterium]HMO82763.1 hypothetical protein [Candidatus Paceibacterota bacterium]